MTKIPVKIKLLREGAKIPEYKSSGAAACDLSSAEEGDVVINPGETFAVHTGIAIEAGAEGVVMLIYPRSGLATKHGITMANTVGVVDEDYRGEIIVPLRNNSGEPYTVAPGERIAQLMFTPVLRAEFEPADSLSETERGANGFGSTGRKDSH